MSNRENLPTNLDYRDPQKGLRSKLPTKLNDYYRHTILKQELELVPGEKRAITSNPLSHEIIGNDGSSTFLVHGTSKAVAHKILQQGLGLNGQYYNPNVPDLFETTKMLALQEGRGSTDATNRNVHALAYRYNNGLADNRYKVIAELPIPNPGTSLKRDQFKGTPLERSDGVSIVMHGEEGAPHGKPYSIPPERIRGYFDVETGEFTYNEQFLAIADATGKLTVNHEVEQPPAE